VRILALDTATENCSAAVLIDGRLAVRERLTERDHGAAILTMIDEVLVEAGATLSGVDAIAFGRGPGSFTGVRLAASVTQGLAYGAGARVVPVSDLRALAYRAFEAHAGAQRALVCNDARMGEVYWACFSRSAHDPAGPVAGERVSDPGEVVLPADWTADARLIGAGTGFAAYPRLTGLIPGGPAAIGALHPRAAEIALLAVPEVAAGRVFDPGMALPVYLRDNVVQAPTAVH
jgi:tRNA threonylcarbamoyladenosine biosynthesis protein TsaB